MTSIRIIKSIVNSSVGSIPSGTVATGDGLVDYVIPGTQADIPADAIYAAYLDGAGLYHVIVQAPAGFAFTHHFAGWDPASWPYPT
jgi:hypothetical protein